MVSKRAGSRRVRGVCVLRTAWVPGVVLRRCPVPLSCAAAPFRAVPCVVSVSTPLPLCPGRCPCPYPTPCATSRVHSPARRSGVRRSGVRRLRVRRLRRGLRCGLRCRRRIRSWSARCLRWMRSMVVVVVMMVVLMVVLMMVVRGQEIVRRIMPRRVRHRVPHRIVASDAARLLGCSMPIARSVPIWRPRIFVRCVVRHRARWQVRSPDRHIAWFSILSILSSRVRRPWRNCMGRRISHRSMSTRHPRSPMTACRRSTQITTSE